MIIDEFLYEGGSGKRRNVVYRRTSVNTKSWIKFK